MKLAFGPLNLTPEQFWEYTPNEIYRLAEGYNWRRDQEKTLVAWQTALLMNIQLKKEDRVSVDQLLGRAEVGPPLASTKEEKQEEFAKLMQILEERKRAKTA